MLGLALVGLPAGAGETDDRAMGKVLVRDARIPAAMAPMPDGGLVFAELKTGRIRRAAPSGAVSRRALARVEVSTDGQRGLLGLAVGRDGQIFASWTNPTGRLVVAQVAPGRVRRIWRGPPSSMRANGGRLALDIGGRIVIGIGDLGQRRRVGDPATPNGKLLLLDPDGAENQVPTVLSSGWNNPFAFTFTERGELWLADNAPGDDPERLTRGDQPGPVTALPPKTVPSGIAARADELLVCGYASRLLESYRFTDVGLVRDRTLARNCRLGVIVLTDGRVAYATETAIRVVLG